MSDDGVKILYAKMIQFYNGLSVQEKKKFNSSYSTVCSSGGIKSVYFWKFLNQYLCFTGVKRNIPIRSGFSPELIKNVNFQNWTTETTGGKSDVKLFSILDRLGFSRDYNIIGSENIQHGGNYSNYYKNKIKKWTSRKKNKNPKFIIYFPKNKIKLKPIVPGFTLVASSISVSCMGHCALNPNGTRSNQTTHAISGIIYHGKPYLVDSNFLKPIPCTWWNYSKLIDVVNNEFSNSYLKNNKSGFIFQSARINYMIYARTSYIDRISPSCIRFTEVRNKISRRMTHKREISPSQLSAFYSSRIFKRKPPRSRNAFNQVNIRTSV